MNNCDIDKLTIKGAILRPTWQKDTLSYEVFIPANIDHVNLDFFTSDSGASYSILCKGGDGSKNIAIDEGDNKELKIDVTAEDGHTRKIYVLQLTRLLKSAAYLIDLNIMDFLLSPKFDKQTQNYTCRVPTNQKQILVKCSLPDVNLPITINGSGPDKTGSTAIPLNVGATPIHIQISSVDKSATKDYVINVIRNALSQFIRLTSLKKQFYFEDPLSLSLLHAPKISQNSIRLVSNSTLKYEKKRQELQNDDNNELETFNDKLEKEINSEKAKILDMFTGTYSDEATVLDIVNDKVSKQDLKPLAKGKNYSFVNFDLKPQKLNWIKETRLEEEEAAKCESMQSEIDKNLLRYFEVRPNEYAGNASVTKVSEQEDPRIFLTRAIKATACLCLDEFDNAELYLKLGGLLEEQYLLEDLFGLKSKRNKNTTSDDAGEGFSREHYTEPSAAKRSAMQEEIVAICKLHGTDSNTAAGQLQALDREYHSLLDQSQSGKADHVQSLYVWKSKQAAQEFTTSIPLGDEKNSLTQSFLAYSQALTLKPRHVVANFCVGRLLLMQGRLTEAAQRFQSILSIDSDHLPSRLCLAIANLKASFSASSGDAAVDPLMLSYLLEGCSNYLIGINNDNLETVHKNKISSLLTDLERFFSFNPICIQAMFLLSQILSSKSGPATGSDIIKLLPEDAYHVVLKTAVASLARIWLDGSLAQQLEWMVIKSHCALIELEISSSNCKQIVDDIDWKMQLFRRTKNLNSFLSSSSCHVDKDSNQMLELMSSISKDLATMEPCNIENISGLVEILLRICEKQQSETGKLEESQTDLRTIEELLNIGKELEGKMTDCEMPSILAEIPWYKENSEKIIENFQSNQTAANTSSPAESTQKSQGTVKEEDFKAEKPASVKTGTGRGTTPSATGKTAATATAGHGATGGRGGGAAAVADRGAPGKTTTAPAANKAAPGKATGPATASSSLKGAAASIAHGRGTSTGRAAAKSVATTSTTPGSSQNKTTTSQSPPSKLVEKPNSPNTSNSDKKVENANDNQSKGISDARIKLPPVKNEKSVRLRKLKAKFYFLKKDESVMSAAFEEALGLTGEKDLEILMDFAESLKTLGESMKAVDVFERYLKASRVNSNKDLADNDEWNFEQGYVIGEIVCLLMKQEQFDDARLPTRLIGWARVFGFSIIEKSIETLQNAGKFALCKQVYAGVHRKKVDDPELKSFFEFKCWN